MSTSRATHWEAYAIVRWQSARSSPWERMLARRLVLLWTFLAHKALFQTGGFALAQCVPNANVVTDTMRADRKALLTQVLRDYDRLVTPPKTSVEVFVSVYRLNLDLHRGLLQMLVEMAWSWHDPRLVWDPSRFSNIENITISANEIWVPDVENLNQGLQRDWDDSVSPLRCGVESTGQVMCNPVFVMRTNCGSSARYWPFDQHECVFEVLSRDYSLVMAYNTSGISMHQKSSQEWRVVSSKQSRHEFDLSGLIQLERIDFQITLARNSDIHVATIAIPALVLSCMVLAQLWLDPRAPGRLMLGCTTVASLCLYLMYLSDTVPDDAEGRAPLIIVFYRDTLVIATLVVVQTVLVLGLQGRGDSPPVWMTASSAWLLSRVPRPVTAAMLLDEDSQSQEDAVQADDAEADSVDKAETPASWGRLARLLDRLCFVALSVTFLGLIIATVP